MLRPTRVGGWEAASSRSETLRRSPYAWFLIHKLPIVSLSDELLVYSLFSIFLMILAFGR
jgi:hypothetical protein